MNILPFTRNQILKEIKPQVLKGKILKSKSEPLNRIPNMLTTSSFEIRDGSQKNL